MRRIPVLALLAAIIAPISTAQPVTQPFTFDVRTQALPAVRNAALTWTDIDNDGDLDALVSGQGESGLTGGVYRNDGDSDGTVQFVLHAGIQGLAYSRSAWADMDGDGDLDVAISGSRRVRLPYDPVTLLYRNDGSGFTEVSGGTLPALHSGALAWGDADSDGDLDLLVTGVDVEGAYRTVLARNSGGTFAASDPGLPGFAFSDAKWGDFDADGDGDLLISGATDAGFRTAVYRNDGGTMVDIGAPLPPLAFSSVDWGDYDGDGDLDLVVGGGQVTPRIFEGHAGIFRNSGGNFAAVSAGITGTLAGALTWGDYDNDGDLDLLSLGAESALGRRTARIFRNVGDGSFENASLLVGAIFASADWGDYDGDGDLDLLAAGATSYGMDVLNLYENRRQVLAENRPAPAELAARHEDGSVILTWAGASDGVTTYDLRIGTQPGASDVRAVPADPETGYRRVGRPGMHAAPTALLKDLEPGRYYWSVQSVGPTFGASTFSTEGSFEVSATSTEADAGPDVPAEFALAAVYPNPFGGQTTIRYDVPRASSVRISVFDVLGREVATVVDHTAAPGAQTAHWSVPAQLAGGIYFIRMTAGTYRQSRTVTLIR